MCLIIDSNVVVTVFTCEDDPDLGDLHTELFKDPNSRVTLVYGGSTLTEEYEKMKKVRRILLELDREGKARHVSETQVDQEEKNILESEVCVSNDQHIIALARVARVRLLCSHDHNLHADFTNPALLSNRRGKVYQNKNHNHLLEEFCR